ncbi:MAG TPA: response regulator transcription factor [Sphingobacteriaceae bacterium]
MHKKILIADDHFAIRSGLRHMLHTRFPGFEFGESVTAAETLRNIREERWDLLILDVEIPGKNGIELLKEIHAERNPPPVLIFSFHNEQQVAVRALRAGAGGYLAKDSAGEQIFVAIEQILAGKKYISPAVAQQLANHVGAPLDKEPHELLSDREYQILLLIGSGKTVSQISEQICLSSSTISTFRARILRKMDLKTNAELTSYVVRRKLIRGI